MEVVLNAAIKDEKQKNELYEVLHLISKQEKLQLEEQGDRVVLSICPQGRIECVEEGNRMRLYAHTMHGGPGFHAYCAALLAWLKEECEASCVLSDDCGYTQHADFDRLKYESFYPWLRDLRRMLLEEEALRQRNYYFASSFYLPIAKEDQIITPCGYIDRHEFAQMDEESLAHSFFLWNEEERDARYYKNCALHLLAKESYGAYARMNETSEKYASLIIDYVEIAYEKDPTLSLPLEQYRQLCQVLGRKAMIADGVQMEEEVHQYRLQEVWHLFHEWRLYAPGCCERSYDAVHDELYLMAPYADAEQGWEWMWRVASHAKEAAAWERPLSAHVWGTETSGGWLAVQEQEDHYMLRGIITSGKERLYLTIAVRQEKDLAYLEACVRQSCRITD